jgi:hypothetical protein
MFLKPALLHHNAPEHSPAVCSAPGNAPHTARQLVTTHRHFEGKFRNKTKIFFLNLTHGFHYMQDEVWYSMPNLHPS